MNRKICSLLIMAVLVCSLLTACGGSGGSVSGPNNSYSTKNDEISTKLSNMYEQADIVAARMANSGLDYYRGNITIDQFKAEYYDAGLTTVQGRYCTAIYADTCIPTRTSDFSGQNVSYKNGNLVGIAIRQYRNMVTTVIIVY